MICHLWKITKRYPPLPPGDHERREFARCRWDISQKVFPEWARDVMRGLQADRCPVAVRLSWFTLHAWSPNCGRRVGGWALDRPRTHLGSLFVIPPTGKSIVGTGIIIHRVVDGKIVEIWEVADTLGGLQQLGILPSWDKLAAQGWFPKPGGCPTRRSTWCGLQQQVV